MLKTQLVTHIAEEAVADDIDIWPAVQLRLARGRRQRRLALGAVAAFVVAGLAAAIAPWWTETQTVNAETILNRAESVVNRSTPVASYHLHMTRTNEQGPATTTTSEVWFGGPDRQRTSNHTTGPDGESSQDVVFNGAETWIASTERGQTQVVHTTGTLWTRPADDPSAYGSLAEVISRYSSDKGCSSARVETDASVAGQSTYVIEVIPKAADCAPSWVASSSFVKPESGAHAPTLRVWVDKQTFLPLKSEVRDGSGAIVDRSEVSSVEYNASIPADTFVYTPPPGVSVSTFSGGTGADVKRALHPAPPASPPHK